VNGVKLKIQRTLKKLRGRKSNTHQVTIVSFDAFFLASTSLLGYGASILSFDALSFLASTSFLG
jgi:hypothetical protein